MDYDSEWILSLNGLRCCLSQRVWAVNCACDLRELCMHRIHSCRWQLAESLHDPESADEDAQVCSTALRVFLFPPSCGSSPGHSVVSLACALRACTHGDAVCSFVPLSGWPQLELDRAANDVYRLEDEGDFETDLAALVSLFAFACLCISFASPCVALICSTPRDFMSLRSHALLASYLIRLHCQDDEQADPIDPFVAFGASRAWSPRAVTRCRLVCQCWLPDHSLMPLCGCLVLMPRLLSVSSVLSSHSGRH
jgi:hypothetical protein